MRTLSQACGMQPWSSIGMLSRASGSWVPRGAQGTAPVLQPAGVRDGGGGRGWASITLATDQAQPLCQPVLMVQPRACTTLCLAGRPLRASGSPPCPPLIFNSWVCCSPNSRQMSSPPPSVLGHVCCPQVPTEGASFLCFPAQSSGTLQWRTPAPASEAFGHGHLARGSHVLAMGSPDSRHLPKCSAHFDPCPKLQLTRQDQQTEPPSLPGSPEPPGSLDTFHVKLRSSRQAGARFHNRIIPFWFPSGIFAFIF